MLWLKPERGRYHLGEAVKVGIFASGLEGLPRQGERRFKLWAVNPSGGFRELTVAPGGGEDWATVEFLPGDIGLYTVAAGITGDVSFSARTYFCVERERNLLPPAGEGLVITPVWYEGSYLGWPVRLEARFNGEHLRKTAVDIFPGFWHGERLFRVTDGAGQVVIDGRNWCYRQHGKGKVFSPSGMHWLVLVNHTAPGGECCVATCTFCPDQPQSN